MNQTKIIDEIIRQVIFDRFKLVTENHDTEGMPVYPLCPDSSNFQINEYDTDSGDQLFVKVFKLYANSIETGQSDDHIICIRIAYRPSIRKARKWKALIYDGFISREKFLCINRTTNLYDYLTKFISIIAAFLYSSNIITAEEFDNISYDNISNSVIDSVNSYKS